MQVNKEKQLPYISYIKSTALTTEGEPKAFIPLVD